MGFRMNISRISLFTFLTINLLWGQNPINSLGSRRSNLPARATKDLKEVHDLPAEREEYFKEWFGPVSVEYLDAINELAKKEVLKYRSKVPFAVTSNQITTLTYPLMGLAPGGGGTWTNIGPFSNLTSTTFPEIDSGRVTGFALHPNWPTTPTLYVAFSGGGVFKSTNAIPGSSSAWTWTSVTDSLPTASSDGNVAVGAIAIDPSDSSGQTLYIGLGDMVDGEGRGFYKTTNGGTSWTAATGLGSATRSLNILVNGSDIFWATNDGLKVATTASLNFTTVSSIPTTSPGGYVWTVKKFNANNLVCSVQASGTGSSGTIYYSTNGGTTWLPASFTGVTGNIRRISIATNSTKGVAEFETGSGVSKGLLVSTDLGQTWNYQAQTGTGTSALFSSGAGSSDGGQDWYNHFIALDPNNGNNVFLAANLALWRSSDGGLTWTQMTHWYGNNRVYVHADFHANAWSSDGQKLFIGNDGGFSLLLDPFRATALIPSWTSQASYVPDLTFIDGTRNTGLATHLIYNLGSTNATSPSDSKYRVSIGLQDNGTRVRQPNGGSLSTSGAFEDTIGGDGFGTVIHPTDGNLILGSLYYTRIYKSTNGGISAMTSSSNGISESGSSSNAPFYPKMHLGNSIAPDSVYTQTNTKIYKSGNFGSTWNALPMTGYTPTTIRNFNISEFNQSLIGIVGPSGTFYKARIPELNNDGVVDALDLLQVAKNHGLSSAAANKESDVDGNGSVGDSDINALIGVLDGTAGNVATWTQYPSSGAANPQQNNSFVWFDTTNDQTIYIASVTKNLALGASSGSKLYKSTNGGATFTSIGEASSGLPYGIPVHVIKNLPGNGNFLLAGTEFGVYFSENGGANWARYGSGLPLVSVRDIYIAPDKSFIRIGTYGRGVWEINTPAFAIP